MAPDGALPAPSKGAACVPRRGASVQVSGPFRAAQAPCWHKVSHPMGQWSAFKSRRDNGCRVHLCRSADHLRRFRDEPVTLPAGRNGPEVTRSHDHFGTPGGYLVSLITSHRTITLGPLTCEYARYIFVSCAGAGTSVTLSSFHPPPASPGGAPPPKRAAPPGEADATVRPSLRGPREG